MYKNVWTKDGWVKREVSNDEAKTYTNLRCKIGYQPEEFESYSEFTTELDAYAEIQCLFVSFFAVLVRARSSCLCSKCCVQDLCRFFRPIYHRAKQI